MAVSTEGDTVVLYLDIVVPALIALTPGLVIHSFIIAVNVNDWLRGGSVTPVDHIITLLGISRMCTQCVIILYCCVVIIFQKSLSFNLSFCLDILDSVACYFIFANFWLTSLLSIVFCLKISTLRTRLFLYLRRMIEQRIAHCIVVILFFSLCSCLYPLWMAFSDMMEGGTYNTTMENLFLNCIHIDYMYNFAVSVFIPLLFFCISSILLFSSLYHHVTKMKMSGNLSINLETYYSAMTFISISFIYNFIYFTGYICNIIYFYSYCEDHPWLSIVLGCLPSLHSFYLIYRTAKLRSHMSKVLHNVIGFLSQRKDPKTREEMEVAAQ